MAPLTKPFLTCIFFLSVTLAPIRIVISFGKPPVISTALKIIVSNGVLSISCCWCYAIASTTWSWALIIYIQTGTFWIMFQCHISALMHLFLYCRTNSQDVFNGEFTTGSSLVIRIFPTKHLLVLLSIYVFWMHLMFQWMCYRRFMSCCLLSNT